MKYGQGNFPHILLSTRKFNLTNNDARHHTKSTLQEPHIMPPNKYPGCPAHHHQMSKPNRSPNPAANATPETPSPPPIPTTERKQTHPCSTCGEEIQRVVHCSRCKTRFCDSTCKKTDRTNHTKRACRQWRRQPPVHNTQCTKCGKGLPAKSKCPCRQAYYCSKECQRRSWPTHRESISHNIPSAMTPESSRTGIMLITEGKRETLTENQQELLQHFYTNTSISMATPHFTDNPQQ